MFLLQLRAPLRIPLSLLFYLLGRGGHLNLWNSTPEVSIPNLIPKRCSLASFHHNSPGPVCLRPLHLTLGSTIPEVPVCTTGDPSITNRPAILLSSYHTLTISRPRRRALREYSSATTPSWHTYAGSDSRVESCRCDGITSAIVPNILTWSPRRTSKFALTPPGASFVIYQRVGVRHRLCH